MNDLINIEAEQALLGCILYDGQGIFSKVAAIVSDQDFADATHQKIFATMCRMNADNKAISAVTVHAYAGNIGIEGQIGGSEYLASLAASVVSTYSVKDYAETIHDLATRRRIIEYSQRLIDEASSLEYDLPASQIAASASSEFLNFCASKASEKSVEQIIDEMLDDCKTGAAVVTPTGYRRLDKALIGGLHAGRTYCIAARMKAGKTTMLGGIAQQVAQNGGRVLYLCLEMGQKQILQRLLARSVGVNSIDFIRPETAHNVPNLLLKSRENMKGLQLYFEDCPSVKLDTLLGKLADIGASGRYDGVVIDYLQLVSGIQRGESSADFQSRVAQRVAEASKRWPNMWILTAAQLNRDDEVRGSDGIRMAVDVLLALKTCEIGDIDGGKRVEAWLEMEASRYTPITDVGTEENPSYTLRKDLGPYYEEM